VPSTDNSPLATQRKSILRDKSEPNIKKDMRVDSSHNTLTPKALLQQDPSFVPFTNSFHRLTPPKCGHLEQAAEKEVGSKLANIKPV